MRILAGGAEQRWSWNESTKTQESYTHLIEAIKAALVKFGTAKDKESTNDKLSVETKNLISKGETRCKLENMTSIQRIKW